MRSEYLESTIKQFEYYKLLGEKTFKQINDEALFTSYNEDSNSIAVIVKHLSGNMLSRWTDFLNSDGEKEWRNRDEEFEDDIKSREELMALWNKGWQVFLDTLKSLGEEDLQKTIYIRNQGHSVMEAINRQLAHYPYHIGQIVYIGKMYAGNWHSLSIPKGQSGQYNQDKFSQEKHKAHFTDEYLVKDKTQILHELSRAQHDLIQFCKALSPSMLLLKPNDKWSALQHFKHVVMGYQAFGKYLGYGKERILKTFGSGKGKSGSKEEMAERYLKTLQEQKNFKQPLEPGDNNELDLNEEIATGLKSLAFIEETLQSWDDSELDSLLCPHPAMGKLTVREMLYFLSFHTEHHLKGIKKGLEAAT